MAMVSPSLLALHTQRRIASLTLYPLVLSYACYLPVLYH